MKRFLSSVLALCLILGCVTVGFTAQAAKIGDRLQTEINDAIANGTDLSWTGGDVELTQPLVINGDVKIDFNGATIKGAPHKFAVEINGGNVELINADIEGIDAAYDGIGGFIGEVLSARPTVNIGNANVTFTNMVVTGAFISVPGTDEELPMSDAISIWGANGIVNLNNVRAFGNTGVGNKRGSKVNVTECIIGGYFYDFYDIANVSFADGTTQYTGYDLFEEALADYVTLTPGEETLLREAFGRWFDITASVKDQNYVEPTYTYDADAQTLTLTASADASFDSSAKSQCAFDYLYVPKTATILDKTEAFVKTGDLTYTATFTGIPGGTVCDTDLIYKLALDLGGDAQAMVNEAIDMLESFVDGIPAMITSADNILNGAVDTYLTGEQGFGTILWNFYNRYIDDFLAQYPEGDERDKVEADVKAVFGPIFDICGYSLKGNDTMNAILASIADGTITPDSPKYQRAKTEIETMNRKYGCSLDVDNGARGYIDVLLDYWGNVRDLAVANGEFNDLKGLGEYVGANYMAFYDFLKEVGECAHNVAAILGDPDNAVIQLLNDNGVTLGDEPITAYADTLNEYISYMDQGFAVIDHLLSTPVYNAMLNKYGNRVPELCGTYFEKAYTIATSPDVYFDFETDGNLIEGFEFEQFATYTTEVANTCKVTVNVSGFGGYEVDGTYTTSNPRPYYTSTHVFNVPMGGVFGIMPLDELTVNSEPVDCRFVYFALSDAKGNSRLSPTEGDLTVYSDTIITLYFSLPTSDGEAPLIDVVFMTNYELSNKWLDTLAAGEIEALPEVPEFVGAEFLGWAMDDISGAEARQSDLLITSDELLELVNSEGMVEVSTIFYAIYQVADSVVTTDQLASVMTMTNSFVENNKAYFSFLFSDEALAEGDEIVECGVLAAGSEETIAAATPNGGTGIVKGNVNLGAYDLPMIYVFGISFNNHRTDRTAYAKAFVTVQHADGTFTTEYTGVYALVIAAY